MTVKELIKELLNAKLDDDVRILNINENVEYGAARVNILPSARDNGYVYIEMRGTFEDEWNI